MKFPFSRAVAIKGPGEFSGQRELAEIVALPENTPDPGWQTLQIPAIEAFFEQSVTNSCAPAIAEIEMWK
ncbi:hypothetical protein [Anatilimnocola floriformis]|uniref:hypothetical protein n=1 Tax=Anatilimnocola floriformis TaxID=2948575 RepID=UPI0020C59943|nr:hypothetical protein [Anatilimnocola floriformis]